MNAEKSLEGEGVHNKVTVRLGREVQTLSFYIPSFTEKV